MAEKILIANRGEIACRVIRTARKMGMETIAVYSDADMNSLHVRMADKSIALGGSLPAESYLDIKKIINACKKTGAKYVHPGYGFLSENSKFAQALEKEGIVFVGPPVEALKMMGDKIRSKKVAKSAGVNIIPSDNSVIADYHMAEEVAKKIGYPVMMKASAGGGGKGIRIIRDKSEIKDAFETVRNEARNSFGDDRIFIEKYIENARHIEIQIIADKYGNVVCLGDRDCSIQRNNQKVVEESPSPFMDDRTRKKMYAQAISLVKKISYYSAGTIECLMDKNKNFYFMEMNTRLQVEHPVTEFVTGVDLVALMINVAKGEKLPFKQSDIQLNGHSIECRVNSEDPSRGFLPSSGRISKYIEPETSEDVRVDTGVYEGYTITMFYDSMIAKLITHGKDRNEAIQKMKESLGSFYIEGVSNNMSFLEAVMHNEKFNQGDYSTSFIKQEFPKGFSTSIIENKNERAIISAALYMFFLESERLLKISGQIMGNKIELAQKFVADLGSKKFLAEVSRTTKGVSIRYEAENFSQVETSWQFGDNVFRGEINSEPASMKIVKNNHAGTFVIHYMGSVFTITVRNARISELEKYMPAPEEAPKPKNLKAPITGKIVKLKVKEGDKVMAGSELVLIEAMKMENIIRAEQNIVIKKINFADGDLIGVGEIMMEFDYE